MKIIAEAAANLEAMIDWALQSHRPHVETRFGHLIVIAAQASGWQTKVIGPDRLGEHGRVHEFCTFSGQCEFDRELQAARTHAAQLAWNYDSDNETHVALAGLDKEHASQLRSWLKFQRDYAAAKANGATDGEAHGQVCGYPLAA